MKKLMNLFILIALIFTFTHIPKIYAASSYTIGELKQLAREAANRHGVDVKLIFAIIQQESAWKTTAVSHAKAKGIMQIMPDTGKGACGLSVKQLFDPKKNLDCGVRYFKTQLDRFGSVKLALCAYNAGPRRAKQGLTRCNKIRETRNYIRRVMAIWNGGNPYHSPTFHLSAKRTADQWFRAGNYKNSEWWRLVCQAIDVGYDKEIGKTQPNAVGKSAKTRHQINTWKKVFRATVNDIRNDNSALSTATIKRKIKRACPKSPRENRRLPAHKNRYRQFLRSVSKEKSILSAKGMADNWFINGNYIHSQWWGLVCKAIDVIYDKSIGTVGQPARTLYQQRIWLAILDATVDDIRANELKLKRSNAWHKERIKKKIIGGCFKN